MKYRKNFLSQVVLRLDFLQVPGIAGERRPELANLLSEQFPQVTPLQLAQIQFSIGPEQSAIDRKLTGYRWRMSSSDGNKLVDLTSDYISLTNLNRSFTNFDNFHAEFVRVYDLFEDQYKVPEFTRVGLRYINEVEIGEGSALNWKGLLSNEVIQATFTTIPKEFKLSRAMHHFVASKDDVTLVTNFGLYNQDFPAPVVRKQFVLDFDCYITGVVANDAMLNRINELNKICEVSFETSIDNKLRELMEVIND